jgi:hypothetical protein
MKNLYNQYRHWIQYDVIIKKKFFFFKEEKISFDGKFYNESEFYDSVSVLFKVIESIGRAGYDISIFQDEVRVEPSLKNQFHVPPIRFLITAKNCANNVYNRHEAILLAIELFTEQYRTYVQKPIIH